MFQILTAHYLRAYIAEMPEKYKGPHIPLEDIERDPITNVAKVAKIPYTTEELKTFHSDTTLLRLENDAETKKVKKHLKKFSCEPIPVSIYFHCIVQIGKI